MSRVLSRAAPVGKARQLQSKALGHDRLSEFRILFMLCLLIAATPKANASATCLLDLSATSINFGGVDVGASATRRLILTNPCDTSIKVSQFRLAGAGFTVNAPPVPFSLAARHSLSLAVSFTPTIASPFRGQISVLSDRSKSPTTVGLSGTGTTLALIARPALLSFGDVTVGSTSVLPVVVTNAGTGSVSISRVSLTGDSFSLSGPRLPATLAPGQDATLTITFAPKSSGSITGSVSVTSNASNSPVVTGLSGTGGNSHSATFSWAANSSPDVAGYNIYRGTESGGPYTKVNSSPITGSTYVDKSVLAGETYYYVIASVNSSGGQSAYSDPHKAVVPWP
jgi:hypothetical protein